MRNGLGVMGDIADHLLQVPLDGKADSCHRRIGRLILEWVLEVDRHFLYQKENCCNSHHDGYAHKSKEIYYGKGQ